MKIVKQPSRSDWAAIIERPVIDQLVLSKKVSRILSRVKTGGDRVLRKLTKDLDGVSVKRLAVSEPEIQSAIKEVPDELKQAIRAARKNIEAFHAGQIHAEPVIETMPGIQCWRRSVAIEKVGLYIPGGTAPLFSTVLMLGIPASLAGCREIILCTPPRKNGTVDPAVLFAAREAGITKIFRVGGAQAIAGMAYGTESIPSVYKIFGPGNQYVTCAKQLVQAQGIAIDMPAGPSEVCVLADDSADPAFVAADLLSQAEHGNDSQVLLVSTSESLVEKVKEEISSQIETLPRKEFAAASLENSKAVILPDINEATDLVNAYAAEHLILSCSNAEKLSQKVINAGSVFIGHYSPESVGDYASGTNHTLPTNGYARAYSGVSVDSFVKKITYQQVSREGLLNIATIVETMAQGEGLDAHARAVSIRRKKISV